MNRTIIIAEAGVNHNGSIVLAKKLIDAASIAGVDYIKFQTFKAKNLLTKNTEKAAYQKANSLIKNESQYDMIKKLELSENDHLELIEYCDTKNIKFLSTAFDLISIDLLNDLNVDIFKIPSGEITNLPYIKKIATLNKPIIISTGMATLGEIEDALGILCNAGVNRDKITILHCNTEYPTPFKDVNLLAMNTIKEAFKVQVGYSDHTLGLEIPIAAVALGAVCIEKHFTLDRTMEGPDHKASLEPNELKEMVDNIRNIEVALGDGIKKPSPSELKNKPIARKSIHIAKDLESGHVLKEIDFVMKRPGSGISPMRLNELIGLKTNKKLLKDSIVSYKDFVK